MGKTIVRAATAADIPRLVELGQVMHAESPRFRDFEFLPERLAGSIGNLLGMEHGLCLVAEHADHGIVGGLLAVAVPHYACDLWQASDLAFFVHPQHRGGVAAARLVHAYREWADGFGAMASIGLSTGVETVRTGLLLKALGAEDGGSIWTWEAKSCA